MPDFKKKQTFKTISESTNVYKKKVNQKELKNILRDNEEFVRTSDIKKPRAEANKIEKSLPTKGTVDFFKKIKKELGAEAFTAALKIQNQRGNPVVNVGTDKGLPFHSRRNYNPLTNEINIPKGLPDSYDNINDYITEVSHAGQSLGEVIPRFIKNDIPAYIKEEYEYRKRDLLNPGLDNKSIAQMSDKEFKTYREYDNIKSPYDTKGTVENYTHETIEPQIKKQFDSYRNFQMTKEEEKVNYELMQNQLSNNRSNMKKQYALGGEITQFNEGGTHEQNPNGGIPMGQGASVEQGETAVQTPQGKFIFSDRIQITPQVASNLSLPKTWIGKTMADYSKKIDKQFDGREDSISTSTKQRMLDKGAQQQEQIKAEQEALAQAQNTNMEQAPEDMMQGQIPQGAEEYVQEPQMAEGGLVPEEEEYGADAYVGAATGALALGQIAFGKAEQDITGVEASGRVSGVGMIGGSAMKGASAGAGFGPIGAAIGGGLGAIAGIAGLGKARKAETLNTQRFSANTNKAFSDNYAAEGGLLEQYKDNDIMVDPKIDPKKGQKVKNADGSYSMRTTTTTTTPGIAGRSIKGTLGSPAVLATKGVNSSDVERNKAFANARKSGQSTFMYKGKSYNTEISGTPGKPAVAPTPDIQLPGLPPTSNTIINEVPLQSNVYKVNASRGTIGGARRDGIGGSVTTGQQFTANGKLANKLVDANDRYNTKIEKIYAPDTENLRGLNPAQLELKNAKAAQRLQELRGTATADSTEVPMGLERKNVEQLRTGVKQFANGGYVKQYAGGGPITGYGTDGKWIKPTPSEYSTDVLKNIHDTIGISSSVPGYGELWGKKSDAALLEWQKTNQPNKYATNSKDKNFSMFSADTKNTPRQSGKRISEYFGSKEAANFQKAAGLTSEGYKFNPQAPILPQRQVQTEVIPTQTKAGFESYANAVDAKAQADKEGKKMNVGDKLGGALRYAAPLMDAYQLSQLKKPQADRLDRLGNRYIPKYADESRQQNIADQELSNTVNAIQGSGASQGASRAALLGAQLNKTKALSSAYSQDRATNLQQDSMAQQFNLGVDQTNLSQSNAEKENMARDKGAYDTEKSKLLSSLGDSAGEIGKEERFKKMTKGMFGYDTNGKYVINEDGSKLYIDGGTKKAAALGGLLMKKRK